MLFFQWNLSFNRTYNRTYFGGNKMNIRNMVLVALFAAVIAVLGLIPPIFVWNLPPITAQTLGVMLAGGILGARLGGLSTLLFIILVAVGAPLLSGGRGGLSVFAGASGGFLLSWPIASFVIGFLVERFKNQLNVWKVFLFNLLGGVVLVYAIGVPWIAFVTGTALVDATIGSSIYLPGDTIKAVIAAIIATRLHKANILKLGR